MQSAALVMIILSPSIAGAEMSTTDCTPARLAMGNIAGVPGAKVKAGRQSATIKARRHEDLGKTSSVRKSGH